MKKTTIIILALVALIFWRETLHARRTAHMINHYEQEIALAQDMAADSCDDRIAEILGQF